MPGSEFTEIFLKASLKKDVLKDLFLILPRGSRPGLGARPRGECPGREPVPSRPGNFQYAEKIHKPSPRCPSRPLAPALCPRSSFQRRVCPYSVFQRTVPALPRLRPRPPAPPTPPDPYPALEPYKGEQERE